MLTMRPQRTQHMAGDLRGASRHYELTTAQKISFSANCRMRASRAAVITPKAPLLLRPSGPFIVASGMDVPVSVERLCQELPSTASASAPGLDQLGALMSHALRMNSPRVNLLSSFCSSLPGRPSSSASWIQRFAKAVSSGLSSSAA